MPKSVLVSYARDDREIARKTVDGLRNAGLDAWWDQDLDAGADFGLEIADRLRELDATVVLWSPSSMRHVYVRAEAARALEHRKLIPVLIAGELNDIPLPFASLNTLVLNSEESAIEQIVNFVGLSTERSSATRDRADTLSQAFYTCLGAVDDLPPELAAVHPSSLVAGISIHDLQDEPSEAVSFTVVGLHNKGKSSLVNKILDQNLLPTDQEPTTALPVVVQYSPEPTASLYVEGPNREDVQLPFDIDLLDKHVSLQWMADYPMPPRHASVGLPVDELRFATYVDLPGTREHIERDRLVRPYVSRSSSVIFVSDARRAMLPPERRTFELLTSALDRSRRTRVAVVLMFSDELSNGDRSDVVANISSFAASIAEDLTPGFAIPVFLISKHNDPVLDAEFSRFRRWLREVVLWNQAQARVKALEGAIERVKAAESAVSGADHTDDSNSILIMRALHALHGLRTVLEELLKGE